MTHFKLIAELERDIRNQVVIDRMIGFLKDRLYFHYPDGRRAEANSGAPAVLAAFGLDAALRLAESKIPMHIVTEWK